MTMAGGPVAIETFPALAALGGVRHGLVLRVPGIEVTTGREAALAALREAHARGRAAAGLGDRPLVEAEQVHGAAVAVVERAGPALMPGVDGLLTARTDVCLGIYVADCCPVYLVAPGSPGGPCIGLVHAGRRGTAAGVVPRAVAAMGERFGVAPAEIVAQLGPCIRPPAYESDFAAEIRGQLRRAGVGAIHDCGRCTAGDPGRYYSYRRERGRTGRLLAVLGLA